MTTIRQQYEQLEHTILSPLAIKADESKGRVRVEAKCPIRTDFQRDRDRIIHSKAFRRLKHKTQVFVDPEEDHFRTRLTHTLEVAQIARTISRALRLNEDLTEAIALGHDLGHTPFGHAGETALDEVIREYDPKGRFRHSDQSLRIVDTLERDGLGLNLTWEVRDGIAKHSKGSADLSLSSSGPATLEGRVVKISDRVAYINHDIDDSVRAGVIRAEDLPEEAGELLGRTHSKRINSMVTDIISFSANRGDIGMSENYRKATDTLKDFLFHEVYMRGGEAGEEIHRYEDILKSLFRYYMDHPREMTSHWSDGQDTDHADPKARITAVCDFVSGMTDRYAQRDYTSKFLKWV